MANKNGHEGVKIGAGLAALAAAAAGAYYFYGSKQGKQRRKDLKGWAVKARGEVIEQLEKLEDFSKENYDKAVDQALKKYQVVKNIDVGEIAALGKELKGHWNSIVKDINKGKKKPAVKKQAAKKSPKK